ncbi:Integrase catalytic core protein [Phytophthora palmivora]|uniref:Integrase catalytic core protein n=1 Tax=Phytophthora palmivora TaxID=4796 RepID=A0A2P4XVI1_9STRA|nr:Integrase catalytic core protein [Phytophthora palmivora]
MEAEFQSIQSTETWILVKRPPNTKIMTISMEAIRVVIVLAFYFDPDLRQIDFTTAFLNGDMDVDVYMEQPELFDDGSGRVCLLKKCLYGLKQASLIWNETLKKYLLKLGFKASIIGDGVYVKWIGDSPVFLTVYVDDVVIAAKAKHIEWLIGELKTEFKLKDLGETIRGMDYGRDVTSVYLVKLNGSLMNKVRAINEAAMLPECMWGDVLGYIVEVDNMSATKALNGITPFEKLFGSKPQVKDLHVCGCIVLHHTSKKKRSSKLDMLADPGVFLGYAKTSLGYRILDLCTGKLIELRDVVFYEDLAADPNYLQNLIDKTYFKAEIELPDHIDFVSLLVSHVHMPVVPQDESSDDGEQNLASCADEMEEALSSEHAVEWKRATDTEYESLMENQTWELVPRPMLKRNGKGEIERHKARLAIKGYRQKYGLDYLETYSPVVRIESVRLVLLLALLLGLECRHVDFVTAFLNGVLCGGVDISMEQPEGYNDGSGRACKLLKGLYGLKQTSRIWNNTLHKHLMMIGFKKYTFDAGVYWKVGDYNKIYLTVYVDDIVIAADPRDIVKVVDALSRKFRLKDLGRVKHLLGMEINYKPGKLLCISQTAYIERMLAKFGLAAAKLVRSPQYHNERTLPIEKDPKLINDATVPFREMVGSLQYLVHCSRPDLANAVRTLGRYGSAYTKENFRQAQRVMRYLGGTKHFGLVYRFSNASEGGMALDAFADADHAGCPETNVWHWQSKKKNTVADDTCASELIAAHKCTKEIKWAQKMLRNLGIEQHKEATSDNQSIIKEVENNGNSQELKHLAKKTRSVAEWVDRGRLRLDYINLFLAMDVKMETDRVALSQETYTRHLVEKFGTSNARIVRPPMDVKARPAKPEEPYGPEVNRADLPYRQILGSLQYLVRCTRPDIANAVCVLGKFMNCYTVDHYALAQRVLMYLKETASYGLVLSKQLPRDDLSIVGYADLGNDLDTRRSISGQVVKLGGCVVAYQSKHQGSTITDTCSAELTAAIYKVMDYVNDGYIQIKYLPSMEMPADTLTKALGKNKFRKHRKQLA